ncbi:PTS sugar transporter subunit IIC [Clostridium neonatale]|uniref:PTS sugar transporter subunit IIC n=1 Tax=Clostridium neonatale TaxID=137838 RepID=UPI0012E4F54F|nr:PTS transporter subunit EIIC [Clostridium neonatale]SUQ53407.1 Lichenan permease IIC component [Clostridium neonatale]
MYKKFLDMLEKYLSPIAAMVSRNYILMAIKDAFILSMPFTVVGSLTGLVKSQGDFWFAKWGVSLDGILGKILNIFGNVNVVAMGLVGVIIVLSSSYYYAEHLSKDNKDVMPMTASIIAFVTYFVTIPDKITIGSESASAYTINFFNYEAMFTALIVGLVTTYLYAKFMKSKFTIKLPDTVPPMVFNSFKAIIPFSGVLLIFSTLRVIVESFGFESIQKLIAQFIVAPLSNVGTGLPAVIIVILIMQLLWFFGIHGFSIMWGLISVIWMPIFMKDIDIYMKTGSLETITHVAPNTLSNVYAMIGGSGSTFALVVLMLIMAPKGSSERAVGKVALIPGLFGINEPVSFGLPIVLNPTMFLPFVMVPIINAVVAYFAISSGLVTPLVVLNSGAEPVFLNVLVLAGFRWSPVILYGVLFILDMFLYAPFLSLQLKQNKTQENA